MCHGAGRASSASCSSAQRWAAASLWVAAVCFFETEADLAAADRLLEAWAAEHLAPLRPGAPPVTGGEVVAQKGL